MHLGYRHDQEPSNYKATQTKFIQSGKIILNTKENLYLIRLEEIVRLEADFGYTTFFTMDGQKIVVCKTLKEYEDLLPATLFFRVHQSHLINLDQIRIVSRKNGGLEAIMTDGSSLPVSRRKKELFIQRLMENTMG